MNGDVWNTSRNIVSPSLSYSKSNLHDHRHNLLSFVPLLDAHNHNFTSLHSISLANRLFSLHSHKSHRHERFRLNKTEGFNYLNQKEMLFENMPRKSAEALAPYTHLVTNQSRPSSYSIVLHYRHLLTSFRTKRNFFLRRGIRKVRMARKLSVLHLFQRTKLRSSAEIA